MSGITEAQREVLSLFVAAGAPRTALALNARLPTVEALERRGLIVARPRPGRPYDMHRMPYAVTPAGRAALRKDPSDDR